MKYIFFFYVRVELTTSCVTTRNIDFLHMASPIYHFRRDLRLRLISFTHGPLLSRAVLISVSVPANNPKKNRNGVEGAGGEEGGEGRFTAFIYM